ncbi:MAG: PPOX class F420-dependent oxidoreductase [Nocardioides sp.]
MDLSDALTVAHGRTQAVLTTIKRDGKPQLSNVGHTVGDDGLIRVSITATRAKYHNLVRTPWAALHVNGADFWSYAVLECDAELTPVAQDPHDATVDELVAVFTAIAGKEHPDWEEYRRAMVTDQRVVLRLRPQRAYGLLSES